MIPIHEIFCSIQGEGPHVGRKAIFVRVAGCDYSCSYCDSKDAWSKNNSKLYDEEELSLYIIRLCNVHSCNYVVLTGGNPCLYDFSTVLTKCKAHNVEFAVETQGSIDVPWLQCLSLLVISPKGPSSGQPICLSTIQEIINKYKNTQMCIKIPVFDEQDKEFVEHCYNTINQCNRNVPLYVSVGNDNVSEEGNISPRILIKYKELVEWILHSPMDNIYVLPQMHTLIWGNRKGV